MNKIYYTITCPNYDVIIYNDYEILLSKNNQFTIWLN